MANESLGSTVLHEHRKIVTLRHLLALVNFIAILASTLITRYFVLIRGTSEGVLLIINILCGINGLQILLCFLDYITKVAMGKYSKMLTGFSYTVGVIWFIAVVAEFMSGSYVLGEARIDLGVIAVFQLLTAIIAYIAWPNIDYATVRKMTHKNVRDDIEKRAKKARGGAAKYVLVCLLMIIIQIGMLSAYKLPPKVYDLFSESRQLQYQLAEDGQSYEVIGVYRGTSSYVNVPAVYNNKPVTKIKTGALSNASFLENNKIDTIDIGTPEQDENGVTTIVSNLLTIESGAIVNDKIITLILPASVIKISDGAISSSSLKTLVYEAKADFSYSYLSCSTLSTVTFSGVEAGKIVSLDGMADTVTLEVAKDTYNNYREKNDEYMSSIRPILPDDEFVVDFYTKTDYYIESIFCKRGESVQIGYQNLKNDKLTDKIAPSVDTIAYIKNKHETGTFGAKADSAFRGWYFDQFFTNECLFSETGTISFTGDTAIYAKWIDEYTGMLDWGTFHPDAEPSVLYWTDEDLVTFPVIDDRPGFEDGISWSVNGKVVTSSQNISESVTVSGKWIFDAPVVDINPYAQDESDTQFTISTDKNAITFTYDEYQALHLEAMMQHEFENHEKFAYSTQWTKVGDLNFSNTNKTIDLQNVPESGEYVLRVIATSPYGDESYAETSVKVTIEKKALDIGTATLSNTTVEYNAQEQHLVYEGVFVHDRISTTYTYYDENGNVIPNADSVKDAGRYKVIAHFEKNNVQEAANYDTRELNAEFVIIPYELEFIGWSTSELKYNTDEQIVELQVGGVRANDYVEIIYEGNKATDAGDYVAKAVGVSNSNYSIKNMDAANNCTHTWKITPKEITVKEWKLDGSVTGSFSITYNGKTHTLEAVPEGVFASDINKVKFIYDQTANTTSAVNANVYTAKIIGVDNDNYTLVSESTQTWEITKKPLTVHFDTIYNLVYNGKNRTVNATVAGIVAKDLENFSREKLLYVGKSDAVSVGVTSIDDNNLVIPFSMRNASDYTLAVSGIDSAADIALNYVIAESKTLKLTIAPKTLDFVNDGNYTYNGKLQTLALKVKGIEAEDLPTVAFDQFTVAGATAGQQSGNYYTLTLNAKDVGTYPVVVSAFTNSNYNVVETTNDLKIKKQRLTVEWLITDKADNSPAVPLADAQELPYNYAGYDVSVKVNGIVNNENVVLTLTGAQNIKNVALHTTVAELVNEASDANKNYVFDTTSVSWKINPHVVNFTWEIDGNAVSNTNGVPTFTYNQNVMNVVPKYALLGDDTLNIGYASGYDDIAKTDASTSNYRVSIESLGNSNYVAGSGTHLEWKIEPKVITINWSDSNVNNVVYNGDAHGLKFTVSGLLDIKDRYITVYILNNGIESHSENYEFDTTSGYTEYSVTGIGTIVNAGKYNVRFGSSLYKKADGSADTNYVVNCTQESIKINQAPLTLGGWQYTVGNSTKAYTASTELIYFGNNYTFSNNISTTLCKRSGVTDDVTLKYTYAVQKNVGDYTTFVELSGEHKDNYYIASGGTVQWSIAPKLVSVDWIVNEFVYSGSYQTQSVTYSTKGATVTDKMFYAGDVINITYTNNSYRDAGTYVATIKDLGNTNYTLDNACKTYQWTISPKKVDRSSLTWSHNEFTYNANNQYPTAYFHDSYLGKTIYVDQYNYPASSKNANTIDGYDAYAVSLESANYLLVGENIVHHYIINPKVVNFTWGFDGSTSNVGGYNYDGKERLVSAYANAFAGDVINITYYQTNRRVHDADTYEFSVKSIDNPNYVLNSSSSGTKCTFTVAPRQITFTWGYDGEKTGAGKFTYDGNTRNIRAYISNLCDGDSVILEYSPNTNLGIVNAGTYTFKVESISNSNYVLPSESACTKSITVDKQTLTLSWVGETTVTYDGRNHSLVAQLTGTISDKKISVNPVYTGDVNSYINVGSYTIYVSGMNGASSDKFDANNFQLPSTTSKKLTINKQTLTATWNGKTDVVYDGQPHSITATLKGTINGSTITVAPVYKNGTNSRTDYGSSTFTISGMGSSSNINFNSANFQLPTDGTQSIMINISKRQVYVSWTGSTSVTYDGSDHSLTAKVVDVNGNPVDFKYNNNNVNHYVNAGTYTISVSLADTTNYTLDNQTTSKNLTINQRTVSLSWSGETRVVYDGYTHSLKATAIGVDGYELGISYSGNDKMSAGTHSVIASLQDSNYKLSSGSVNMKELTILPQPVSVAWTESKVEYDGQYHRPYATVLGINDGKAVSFSYSSTTTHRDVGTWTYSVYLNNFNYTFDGGEGSTELRFTIVPQAVKINWSGNKIYEYTGEIFSLVPTVTDKSGTSIIDYTISGTSSFSDVGTYTATIVGLGSGNYTLTGAEGSVSATAQVIPMDIRIEWSETELEFNGSYHYFIATVLDANDEYVSFSYQTTNHAYEEGEYVVTITLDGNAANYNIISGTLSETFTIS